MNEIERVLNLIITGIPSILNEPVSANDTKLILF